MPKRTDLRTILIVGSGPIVIGQACEFDYSGTQACRALRREGYRVVLVNSNPATIMTDPEFADATYVEPLVPEIVEQIIERERPDALLPTVGGQTGINLALALDERGVARAATASSCSAPASRRSGSARTASSSRQAMEEIGLRRRRSGYAGSLEEARAIAAGDRLSDHRAPELHARRRGRRRAATTATSSTRWSAAALEASPVRQRAARGVGPRLEGVRARGDARPRRQRDRGLLGRERRRHGRPHRRLDHRARRSRRSPTASTRRCATTPSR